jgi:hypothetical protein
VTANGWDANGVAGNESPQAGSTPRAWDPATGNTGHASHADDERPHDPSGQAESASGPLLGGLTSGAVVPGMAVRSPALEFLLSKQRRRVRHLATVAASVLAIVVVVAAVTIAAHNGSKKAGSAQLTAAQVVQQATRQQKGLHSESADFSEHLSGRVSATVTGTVQLQREPLLMAMNMSLAGGSQATTMRAIVTDKAMYLKLSSAAGLPGNLAGKWLKIPLTGLGPSSPFASLQQELQNENPTSQLAGLAAASHLHAAGQQVVSGVTTTRYNGSFAPSAAVKALPAAQRSAVGQYLNLIKGDVAVSVWIDSSRYVRKIQETESTGAVTNAISCTFGSFNQPVKIALPPLSQVYSPPASALNA